MPLLDGTTGTAEAIGAVNTIWYEGGRLLGDNTDAYGFLTNLDRSARGWDDHRRTALVLGAGGAALAIIHALRQRGFGEIRIANRTVERAQAIARRFGEPCRAMPLTADPELYRGADLVVNTTSLTMSGAGDAGGWPGLEALGEQATVTDIVYVPLKTSLLAAAEERGLRTVDGLGMLLHQAVPGFERWFGIRPEVTDALRARIVADLEIGCVKRQGSDG